MLKVLANQTFNFSQGDKDSKGKLNVVKTKLGFCELPDWVAQTELFKLAVKDKSIQPVESSYRSEDTVKLNEEVEKLRAENLALRQAALLPFKPTDDSNETEPVEKPKRGRKPKIEDEVTTEELSEIK